MDEIAPKDNIYFNLSSHPNALEKIKKLLNIYKTMLIQDQYYYSRLMDFGKQIVQIIEYKDPKNGYKLFNDSIKLVFETLFEIVLKSKRNDSLYVIARIDTHLEEVIKKAKPPDIKNLNLFLLNKIIECANHIAKNGDRIDEIEINKKSDITDEKYCSELFCNFIRSVFIEYITSEIKDKTCIKPCLDLITALLGLNKKSGELWYLVKELFYKENFYLLKDHKEETAQILAKLLDCAISFNEKDEDLNDDERKQLDYLKQTLEYYKERVVPFPDVTKSIQTCLIKNSVLKPIELNITNEHYYEIVHEICEDLVSFEDYSFNKNDLDYLVKVFNLAISPDIFDSIQLGQIDEYSRRLRFYQSFYENIFKSLEKRNDISNLLNESFIRLVDVCVEKNEFVNEFKRDEFTINYNIMMSLAKNSIERKNSNLKLVEKLIDFFFFSYESINSDEFKSNFYELIETVSQNYTNRLANHSDKLWEYYIKTKNDRLVEAIKNIFRLIKDKFIQSYHVSFTELMLDSKSSVNDFYNILLTIAEHKVEYFFKKAKSGELIFIELIGKAKLKNTKNEISDLTLVGGLFAIINQNLLKQNTLSSADKAVLFENRKKFLRILFVNGETDTKVLSIEHYGLDLLVRLIYDLNYYIIMNIEGDKNAKLNEIVMDAFDLFKKIAKKEAAIMLILIRHIAELDNRAHASLLKDKKEVFIKIKNDKKLYSVVEIKDAVDALLDLIEGRNLESIDTKVNQNASSINGINKDLNEKNAKIQNLDKNVKQHELKITNINQNINGINEKIGEIDETLDEHGAKIETIDAKTLLNVPLWCKDIAKAISNKNEWVLVAKRLNFNEKDIKGWLNQPDPCMSMFQEWFIVNKTSDAIYGLLKVFKELNKPNCVKIIQSNINLVEKNNRVYLNEDEVDFELINNPPQIFISYEWSSKDKAELLKKHLYDKLNEPVPTKSNQKPTKANASSLYKKLNIWFDDGNMGGGVSMNNRIDRGLRVCHILLCLITEEASKDQTCLNQISLAVQLGKPIIPLLLDSKLKWPPAGSLGPILSEYLFIRFFQRLPKEATNDERYWPADKFEELAMQVKQLIPTSALSNQAVASSLGGKPPEVFISYQWDKQKQIINLYKKLTGTGLTVWLDVHQMAGGDSLYDKIDRGIRNCCLVISCVTTKYGLSANCRKEIALADALSKPIIPLLLEGGMAYPPAGPMAPSLSVIECIDFTDQQRQDNWDGQPFDKLVERMQKHLPEATVRAVKSKACLIS